MEDIVVCQQLMCDTTYTSLNKHTKMHLEIFHLKLYIKKIGNELHATLLSNNFDFVLTRTVPSQW